MIGTTGALSFHKSPYDVGPVSPSTRLYRSKQLPLAWGCQGRLVNRSIIEGRGLDYSGCEGH